MLIGIITACWQLDQYMPHSTCFMDWMALSRSFTTWSRTIHQETSLHRHKSPWTEFQEIVARVPVLDSDRSQVG
eukprot:m.359445 g.359445  ORF g.359445 m.359445 type:complete len:74 (+) comp18570_c0_seq1:243-464(+)